MSDKERAVDLSDFLRRDPSMSGDGPWPEEIQAALGSLGLALIEDPYAELERLRRRLAELEPPSIRSERDNAYRKINDASEEAG